MPRAEQRAAKAPRAPRLPPADAAPAGPRPGERFPWAFTIHDTAAIRAKVGADLAIAAQEVRAADPHLRALVLTGGFARGEGAVLHGQPQNDYDFLALRGAGAPRVPWAEVVETLEARLRLPIDLQPVWVARLPWVRRSIFWYETALRGRAVWGDPQLLDRIGIREPAELDRREALRLLANRAAGLVLYERADPGMVRIQAAKALLASLDAHLLALGLFAPSQRERWAMAPDSARSDPWLAWAYEYKVDPGRAPTEAPRDAWHEAARAVLDAVPAALALAGFRDLQEAARRDTLLDNARYAAAAWRVPGLRALARHPTGRLQAATLRLLAERAGLPVPQDAPRLEGLLTEPPPPGAEAIALERLRAAAPT